MLQKIIGVLLFSGSIASIIYLVHILWTAR